jgi:biotin synthase
MIGLRHIDAKVVQAIISHHARYNTLTGSMMTTLLSIGPEAVKAKRLCREYADEIRTQQVGDGVSYRGLLEFSNICNYDCYYCGIRGSNSKVDRYELDAETIIDRALWCADQGYGSLMLQSGQRNDEMFIDQLDYCIQEIKRRSTSSRLPQGLGITLGIGEQPYEHCRRLFDAGAHRYLLRIETTNRKLYDRIHPEHQSFDNRLECLRMLKEIGYQVGTGVMIGIPGQSLEMLSEDIQFLKTEDIDMIGMGPYIVHPDSRMAHLGMMEKGSLLQLALNMIAVTRIYLQDVNIAAATALQAVIPDGREQGLKWGANVVMPNATPREVREGYQLYSGKPCLNEASTECSSCLSHRIHSVGRTVTLNSWGDSPHAVRKGL